MKKKRCFWCEGSEIYEDYHDKEWGVPEHDDQKLFEKLCLEGAQAGLSWITILKRRDNYRKAFDKFNAVKLSKWTEAQMKKQMSNEGIIRNRLKIWGVVKNAKAYLAVRKEFDTFDTYIWSFVDGKTLKDSKAQGGTERSVLMSKDLKKRGFTFVGPTICYAYMQATGMVDEHLLGCFKYKKKRSP